MKAKQMDEKVTKTLLTTVVTEMVSDVARGWI